MLVRIDAERPAPRRLMPVVEALRRDEVVIYPTDTGYAFGCALSSPKGIAALRRLKGIDERHRKPLSMLVRDLAEVGKYGHVDNQTFRVIRRLLPGPYTMILRATSDVPRGMRNRNHEVGLRFPDHRVCQMLLDLLGEPLLTGSVTAAEAGEFELEDPEEFERRFGPAVEVIIDGGPMWPEPSTVLDMTSGHVEVLREGQGSIPR
jgi:tRNA threonylcarbamoyl adenosine modification protein (Sua5/YciO/YrdC/YwlC family)